MLVASRSRFTIGILAATLLLPAIVAKVVF